MAPPNEQPTLPAEGTYTDLEQLFISEQPKNLWPQNQNSNLGALRRVLTGVLQDVITTIEELGLETFLATASDYLGLWEAEYGLPVAPTGRTEAFRRSVVQGRLSKGAFTRTRRREIVEAHIQATFGTALALTPEGLSLTADGLSLHSESGEVTDLYAIIEDIEDFSYEVLIEENVNPDLASLERELLIITPAHYSFTISEVPAGALP